MAISTINSNQAANNAISSIAAATTAVQNDVSALSTGNRIVQASTDVVALSIGTSLQNQSNALTTALSIAGQGTSLLQVADGALSQIQTILQRMQAIATSAQAGTLSSVQRGYLDTEFQGLSSQIDQLANTTNFNGVNLLNGSIAGGASMATNATQGNTSSELQSTSAIAIMNSGAFVAGTTLTVNGYTLNLNTSGGTNYSGATAADSAANVAAALNQSGSPLLADYHFVASGTSIFAQYVGANASTLPGFNVSTTAAAGVISSTNNATFNPGLQVTTINAVATADTMVVNGVSIAGTTWNPGGAATTVITQATALANYLNSTTNSAWAGITFASDTTTGAIYAYYSGTTSPGLTMSDTTTPASLTTPPVNKALNTFGNTGLSAGSFSAVGTIQGSGLFVQASGSTVTNYGNAVDLSSLAGNASFIGNFGGSGTIGSITASYSSSGTTFSVVVGNDTYTTGAISNATLTSTTAPVALTFTGANTISGATEGGSFTLNLQPQTAINNQTQAGQLASSINAALSGTSVYQNRVVQSFNNSYSAMVGTTLTGTLKGATLSFNNNNFSSNLVSSVSVSAPTQGTTDAKITMVVGGQTYSTQSGLGNKLATNTVITLVNQSNPSQTIELTTGSTNNGTAGVAIDLSSSSNATAFQTALSSALGVSSSNAPLTFQVGSTSTASISVALQGSTSSALFGGIAQNVQTASAAATAYSAVTNALNTIGSARAAVGALEEEFNYASASSQAAQQNVNAASSALLSTDVAATSTTFATDQVRLQGGIAVLAQAQQLQQAIVKLL